MENLKVILADKGVTATKLSADVGMSKTTISNYVKGRTKRIDIEIMIGIADYLGVTLDELFGRATYETEIRNKKAPFAEGAIPKLSPKV